MPSFLLTYQKHKIIMKHVFFIVLSIVGLQCTAPQLYAICPCSPAGGGQSLDLYWVGGNSIDFNDPCNWRLDSVTGTEIPCQLPRSGDNVYFEDASFSGSANPINIDRNSSCKSMIFNDNISAGKGVSLQSPPGQYGISLDIYGSLELATHMSISGYNAEIKFTCTDPITVHISSRGQNFRIENMYIDLAPGAELQLTDAISVNNRDSSNRPNHYLAPPRGGIIFNSGHFNTNAQNLSSDFFLSRSGQNNRQLTITNSYLLLDGATSQNYGTWGLDFSGTNYTSFSSAGSHVHIFVSNPSSINRIDLGNHLAYDTLSLDLTMSRYHLYPSCQITANHFFLGEGTIFNRGHGSTIEADHFHMEGKTLLHETKIITDDFQGPSGCDMGVLSNCTLRRQTPGTLTINNLVLQGVSADATTGTFNANNCVNNGNSPNITFAPISSCNTPLLFRYGGNSQDWSDLSNWVNYHHPTTAATHIPTAFTDVYFDANSFSGASTPHVNLDETAFARDLRWMGTVAGADLRLLHHLMLNGTLELDSSMASIDEWFIGHELGRGIVCMGTNNDSLITHGHHIASGIHLLDYANYHIVDTINVSLFRQHGSHSHFYVNNAGVRIANYLISRHCTWNNALMDYWRSGWTGINATSEANYTNTTFYLNNSGNLMIRAYLPNVVIQGRGAVYPYPYIVVQGDLTVKTSSLRSMKADYSRNSNGRIAVRGDLILEPGQSIVLNSNGGSYLRVRDRVISQGGCATGMNTIRSDFGTPVEFSVNGTGSTISKTFLQGLDASSGNALTANSSTDGGNNTNIQFASGTGQNFYWVAHATTLAGSGNWSDPGHWTTNPSATVGDSTCIPTSEDNVFFNRAGMTCTVDQNAFCRNFTVNSNLVFNDNNDNYTLYIGGDFILDATMTMNYNASVSFVGSGTIRTNGVTVKFRELNFNQVGGVWNQDGALRIDGPTNNSNYNLFILSAGTYNTNNFDVYIKGRFISNSSNVRELNLGTSNFAVGGDVDYYYSSTDGRYMWDATNTDHLTLRGADASIHILPGNDNPHKVLYLGNGGGSVDYGHLIVEQGGNSEIRIHGTANIGHLELNGNMYIQGNPSMDSLTLNGGFVYTIEQGKTLTLTAPHGKVISKNVDNSSFISLESSSLGQVAYLHKDYGGSFCMSYVKVRNIRGTKAATAPPVCAGDPLCWDVQRIETGTNSDSIYMVGGDWGTWAFSLPPLQQPAVSGPANKVSCKTGSASLSYPIEILGTDPYLIDYTWTANNGLTGTTNNLVAFDDDNDPTTPYIFRVPLSSTADSSDYVVSVNTTRCGQKVTGSTLTTHVVVPAPKVVVQTNRRGSCTFQNQPDWFTILDYTDNRPMLSLRDGITPKVFSSPIQSYHNLDKGGTPSTDLATLTAGAPLSTPDTDSLGLVNAETFVSSQHALNFTYNGEVYKGLKRWWRIRPDHNAQAAVRLYFSSSELYQSFGMHPHARRRRQLPFYALASNMVLLKVSSPSPLVENAGTVAIPTTATVTAVPYQTLNITGAAATPFFKNLTVADTFFRDSTVSETAIISGTDTAAVLGIEFEVDGFSDFVLVRLNDPFVFLPLDFLRFDASVTEAQEVALDWAVESQKDVEQYTILRSRDGVELEEIATVKWNGQSQGTYRFVDEQPYVGTSYYRLKTINSEGTYSYSNFRSVEIGGLDTDRVEMYPNPAQSVLNIRIREREQRSANSDLQIRLVDALGRIVKREKHPLHTRSLQLDLKGLASGVYKVQIRLGTSWVKNQSLVIRQP